MKLAAIAIVLCHLVLAIDALPLNLEFQCTFWFCRPSSSKSYGGKDVECDKIAKYSVEWFIDHASSTTKPKPATCLFYTRGLSLKAQYYAKKKSYPQLTTIWDVWPRTYYNKKINTKNPLRCIMQQKETDQRMYFENMSKAFASLCDVFATVMDASVAPNNRSFDTVNKAGIWFKTEFPMLQKGYLRNKVNQIEAISPDGLTVFPYWTRSNTAATSADDVPTNKNSASDNKYTLGKVADGNNDISDNDQDDIYPGWWDEDGVLDQKELEDWQSDL